VDFSEFSPIAPVRCAASKLTGWPGSPSPVGAPWQV
jgi:hypothetical protein